MDPPVDEDHVVPIYASVAREAAPYKEHPELEPKHPEKDPTPPCSDLSEIEEEPTEKEVVDRTLDPSRRKSSSLSSSDEADEESRTDKKSPLDGLSFSA